MHASTVFTSIVTAAFFTLAKAHGEVVKIEVAGQTFNAPLINAGGDTGPFNVPSNNSPVTDVTSDNMFCGAVGNKATSTPSIDLSKGNTISFYWGSGYSAGATWPHNTGPMFLYMAKCDGADCSSMTPSNTNFIKVEQQGFVNGQWAQAALKAGQPATFTIPSDLASGKYLVRHEVINLASTDENYPACSQFDITGGSNDYSSAKTAKFPGAYSATDAGLVVAGSAVYSIKSDAAYVFPGPDPINPTDGSSSGSGSSVSPSGSVSIGSSASNSSVAIHPTSILAVSAAIPIPTPSAVSSSPIATMNSSSTAAGSSSPSPSPSPSPSSPSSPSPSPSSPSNSCDTAWTSCNASYMSATSSASKTGTAVSTPYTCQTDYESCVAKTNKAGSAASSSSSGSSSVVSSRSFGRHLRRHHAGMSRMESH